MFQCKECTEPERISGKWVEVMNSGVRQEEKTFVFSTMLSTAKNN